MHPSSWRIKLLGGLWAVRGNDRLERFQTQKTAALFAYLALHANKLISREVLVDALWPDADLSVARNRLSSSLVSLRHQLEPPGIPRGTVLEATQTAVRLTSVATDVADFEEGVRRARTASPSDRVEILAQAVAVYDGALLPGLYEEWIIVEQQRLDEIYLHAAEELVGLLTDQGQLAAALASAQKALTLSPLHEPLHIQVMKLLIDSGQPSLARRHFEELEQRLAREGVEPSPSARHAARNAENAAEQKTAAGWSPVPELSRVGDLPDSAAAVPPPIPPVGTFAVLVAASRDRLSPPISELLQAHFPSILRPPFKAMPVPASPDGVTLLYFSISDAVTAVAAALGSLRRAGLCTRTCFALDAGELELKDGAYQGPTLHRATCLVRSVPADQVLLSDYAAVLARRDLPAGTELQDIGDYRLRGWPEPERLHRLILTIAGDERPPPGEILISSDRLRPQEALPDAELYTAAPVPLPLTGIIGREDELAQIRQWISPDYVLPGAARLMTLTGPGGVGKTRLALEAASLEVERFRGAVWIVPLVDLTPSDPLLDAIAKALQLPPDPIHGTFDQVQRALSRRPSLLLLDNFEHLVEEGALMLYRLLQLTPKLICLVTSRRVLGLDGEQEFPVPPLAVPGHEIMARSDVHVEQVMGCAGLQLFVRRAQLARVDFQLTPRNARVVAELVWGLEGLPLAIELAAGWARVLTPQQMLDKLSNQFDLLVSRRRGQSPRHRSLRAVMEWSYQLLEPPLTWFLSRLSVFRGGWTLEAAAHVCEAESLEIAGSMDSAASPMQAMELLAQLRERSLVVVDDRPDETRYHLLETVREYAAEQLSESDRKVTRSHHAHFFHRLVVSRVVGSTEIDPTSWAAMAEAEHLNVRSAMEWLQSKSQTRMLAVEMAFQFSVIWQHHGFTSEGRISLRSLLAYSTSIPAKLRAELFYCLAHLDTLVSDFSAALDHFSQSLSAFEEVHDTESMTHILCALANVALNYGRLPEAAAWAERGAQLAEKHRNQSTRMVLLITLGEVYLNQGDHRRGSVCFHEALEWYEAQGDRVGMANALHGLTRTVHHPHYYRRSRDIWAEMAATQKATGNLYLRAAALNAHGFARILLGETEGVGAVLEESRSIYRELGVGTGIGMTSSNLARLAAEEGDLAGAKALAQESVDAFEMIGDRQGVATALRTHGDVFLLGGDNRSAAAEYRHSIRVSQEIGEAAGALNALQGIAAASLNAGDSHSALRLLAAITSLRDAIGCSSQPPRGQAEYHRLLSALRSAFSAVQWEGLWSEGSAMSLDEAAALGLDAAI